MTTRVVHCKREAFDEYIGRPSPLGNPFQIGRDGSRTDVISKYETYIRARPHLMKLARALKGKTLGCWCAPSLCHGDVIAAIAEEA